ncbi:MAG: glutamine--tRNA ligase/YqeY domain fusion protein [Candidatus Eremiobacteraeota bacterium]|nr:glutamine--tRNA ligase/YqeY domain fusion protein [Candidatus Eremiobacteraeota bacterium]MCW5870279.1 glutamine--tRNA ligase/YqeY domain fusion protein [Candidatus Eremiobacteraeota bacterium]
MHTEIAPPANFIRQIVEDDLHSGKHKTVVTRFPPEPNGYLHIGHAKSIWLNFSLAQAFGGVCHLRMDDTNPLKEDAEYVEAIKRDVRWLGFDWGDKEYHAADYFQEFYDCAVQLIKLGKAYVCDLSADEVREYRGTLTEPGRPSPWRERSVEENLELLSRMKNGDFADGTRTLRAKIDMASPNINLRDPAIYRIRKAHHHRAGDAWCIYPMYDYAHCISDSIEGITHSICTLEFENHRPLYDWFLDTLELPVHPQQIEFSKLKLQYTMLGKRKLREMVEGGLVAGWDDPRMPTLAGLRRRGYTPEAIRDLCEKVGVTKSEVWTELSYLSECVRNDLNTKAHRVMGVLRPLKLVLTNYPEGQIEELDAAYFPEDVGLPGSRKVPFGRELFIEQEDFMENPPKKYFRLQPGAEVRLRRAYIIKCQEVIKNEAGEVVEVHCTYDPDTKSGGSGEHRKVKGTIHWVEATTSVTAEVRLYEELFTVEQPDNIKDGDFRDFLNPHSLVVLEARLERSLFPSKVGDRFQFERQGFFIKDLDSTAEKPVFNRIVPLKDGWAKVLQKQ